MSLGATGFNIISSKERFSYEEDQDNWRRKKSHPEAMAKKQEQLKEATKTTVHVGYPEKINGTWQYMLTISCVFPDGSQRTWQIRRHYNQFYTLFEHIGHINSLQTWFNFPGRALFQTDSVLNERHITFQKFCDHLCTEKTVYNHPFTQRFLNPYDPFEIHD